MSGKVNGWKKVALVAGTVVALGGAVTVGKAYVPWAPRITFAIAAENKLIRLESNLITLLELEAQAKSAQDPSAVRRLKLLIKAKELEMEEIKDQKEAYK